jgi:hypothetical protein
VTGIVREKELEETPALEVPGSAAERVRRSLEIREQTRKAKKMTQTVFTWDVRVRRRDEDK